MRHLFFAFISLTLLTACNASFLKTKEAKQKSTQSSSLSTPSADAHKNPSLHGNYKKYKTHQRCKKHCRRHHHKHYDPALASLNSEGHPKTVKELIHDCYKLCDRFFDSTHPKGHKGEVVKRK